MNIHRLARTTPVSRALIAARRASGIRETVVAAAARDRPQDGSEVDPSAAAGRDERASMTVVTSGDEPDGSRFSVADAVLALRRLKFTQAQIAQVLKLSKSRTQRVVASGGLGKLSALEPPVPDNRYERTRPGELVHVDTKKLGRFYRPGHRVTGDRASPGFAETTAGNFCTSRSMTGRAWLTPSSWPTRKAPRLRASYVAPQLSFPGTGSDASSAS